MRLAFLSSLKPSTMVAVRMALSPAAGGVRQHILHSNRCSACGVILRAQSRPVSQGPESLTRLRLPQPLHHHRGGCTVAAAEPGQGPQQSPGSAFAPAGSGWAASGVRPGTSPLDTQQQASDDSDASPEERTTACAPLQLASPCWQACTGQSYMPSLLCLHVHMHAANLRRSLADSEVQAGRYGCG